MQFDTRGKILVTCFNGLAPYIRQEVEALGFKVDEERQLGVEVTGTMWDAARLNLHVRSGLNVLYRLWEGQCNNADDLYRQLRKYPWEDIIPQGEYISLTSHVDNPTIRHTNYPVLKAKDAIVDRMAEVTGVRPDAGPQRENIVLFLYWKDKECKLYLNTSGQKMTDRGYRRLPHKAPLRESLAAAIMMETGYDGQTPLVCPMCGSGTLAIEAALMAQGRAPGLLRSNFGFMHVQGYEAARWQEMRKEAQRTRSRQDLAPIIATDIDPAAVNAARKNAQTAGVDGCISFSVCDFAQTAVPPGGGILVLNPEYGMRLGEIRALEEVYGRLGDFFKQECAGYTAYVFTGNLDLAKKIHLKPSRRFVFWNAKIECRLLKYELYAGSKRTPKRE